MSNLHGDGWISLEYIKGAPRSQLVLDWCDKRVKIFSNEWGYYWRGTGSGYTCHPAESDTVTLYDAILATWHCGNEKGIIFHEDKSAVQNIVDVDYSTVEARCLAYGLDLRQEKSK